MANANFQEQVAVWLGVYRDTYATIESARVARTAISNAANGERVLISNSFEGGSASSVVVRDKLAQVAALNQLIQELDDSETISARRLMVHANWSENAAVT